MDRPDHFERAAFYRAALFLGLVDGATVVRWADDTLSRTATVPAAFVEIASTPPGDLTALRLALLDLCGEQGPTRVVTAVLGLIGRHLSSGRRSLGDTMTVLKQFRGSVRLAPETADALRQFEVQFARALLTGDLTTLETRLYPWLGRYAGADEPFLSSDRRL
jgi:hypothetical protein